MDELPSRAQLTKIGKALAAGQETAEQLDALDVLLGRCDEVQVDASTLLSSALQDFSTASGAPLSVRGRAKTLTTLREKLERMGGQTLPVVRDLAGLRIVGDITLDEQDRLLVAAGEALGVTDVKVIDRRAEPVRGYRALHAEFVIRDVRVELQVRTQLQHVWAEIYERAGDRMGRQIRYPDAEVEAELVDSFPALESVEDADVRFLSLMHIVSGFVADQEEFERQFRREVNKRPSLLQRRAARRKSGDLLVRIEAARAKLHEVLQVIAASADDLVEERGGER